MHCPAKIDFFPHISSLCLAGTLEQCSLVCVRLNKCKNIFPNIYLAQKFYSFWKIILSSANRQCCDISKKPQVLILDLTKKMNKFMRKRQKKGTDLWNTNVCSTDLSMQIKKYIYIAVSATYFIMFQLFLYPIW